jgi:hypothetical protein
MISKVTLVELRKLVRTAKDEKVRLEALRLLVEAESACLTSPSGYNTPSTKHATNSPAISPDLQRIIDGPAAPQEDKSTS